MKIAAPLILCALAVSGASANDSAPAEAPPTLQLSRDVRPERYELALEVDPRKEGFSGSVRIHAAVGKATQVIWLHAQDLQVEAAEVEAGNKGIPARFENVNDEGLAKLTTEEPIPAGPAILKLTFSGHYNKKLVGLYVAHAAGLAYASTQFETLDARRAFPCFDDPQFKTPFDLSLTVPAAMVAAANTFPTSEKLAGEKKTVTYARTRPLPTYLVALAVGPFDVVEGAPLPPNEVRKRPLRTRGLAPKGRGGELANALAASAELIPIMERYLGIEYPYEKLDHVAIPDFEHGAMENAGLIIYRETALLFREGISSEERREGTAGTIAHEEAHQWFGDLVTLPWWTDAWLNEGFATWMGTRTMREWKPKNRGELSAVTAMTAVMNQDELVSGRAIRQPLTRLSDVWNQFDFITYTKGASVLRMFERWAGPDKFRDGVRAYLREHADGTGTTDSLLQHLEAASGKSVAAPFRTFLDLPGVPLVAAKVDCGDGAAKLQLRQTRYLPLGSTGQRDSALWQIPVCARWSSGGSHQQGCTLLSGREGTLDLGKTCPDWVMPNAEGTGYYRWSLEAGALGKLSSKGYPELSPQERLSLADALQAAPRAGAMAEADAMAALTALASDPTDEVSGSPIGLLGFALHYLAGDALPDARRYVSSLYRPVAEQLGWKATKGEPRPRARLRGQVLTLLALDAEDAPTRKLAGDRGRAYLAGGTLHPEAVSPDLAGLCLTVAMQDDDGTLFEAAVALLPKIEDAGVRSRLLRALGATRDPARLERALGLALLPGAKHSDRLTPLGAAFDRPESREHAWRWLKAHFDDLSKLLPAGYVSRLPGEGGRFCDEAWRTELETFFAARAARYPGMPRNLAKAEEQILLCAAQKRANATSAQGFFRRAVAPTR